jgi:(1->4)-alpha-D-glucan 1-alpha-D-glucosylmutase
LLDALRGGALIPGATYRIQLHSGFTFHDAAEVVPYLAALGVTHLYCSPVLQAAPGSTHGYDVVDPERLSDALGGEEGFRLLLEQLESHGQGMVLDIVPNHMAVAGRSNRWWWDVLENGPSSVHARRFDVDWQSAGRDEEATVLAPFLGDHYGRVLEAGEIQVRFERGAFTVRYGEREKPLSPATFDELLEPAAERLSSVELVELARDFRALDEAPRGDAQALRERHRRKEELLAKLRRLCEQEPELVSALETEARLLSADADRLDHLLRRQNYRMAYWRIASEELDYRRFFNIESLVGLRVEDEEVFQDTHRLVLELVGEESVHGLRVDHIDGLRDPRGYLKRLKASARAKYTLVEKILERSEELPCDWPVHGTTGYEFASRVNNLFVAGHNEAAMTACYQRFSGEEACWSDVVHASKRQVMAVDLRAEVESLARLLTRVCEHHRRHRDHTRRELRTALVELVAAFPVYRTYVQPGHSPAAADRAAIARAVEGAHARAPQIDAELIDFLGSLALLEHKGPLETELAQRLPQLTAPVMAKGVEDTAFYRYHRLVSLNEVGGDPGVFGRTVSDFHADTSRAAARFPASMLTLSTHDTKRSADVRARLNLLSEVPAAWESAVARLAEAAARNESGEWPDANTRYLLYQTLVGAWPIPVERVTAFMLKAVREAKIHTSWVSPEPEYEGALERFVRGALSDTTFLGVLEGFLAEHRLIARGRTSSLAQTTLLLTCPGVADLYQGSELWDLSLVDPDNRRPVDYALRRTALDGLDAAPPNCEVASDDEGVCKLFLVRRLLCHRRGAPELYRSAQYEPLAADGPKAEHVVAFSRGGLITVVPRLIVGLGDDWQDTEITIPRGRWRCLWGGRQCSGGRTKVARLLDRFPVAVLVRDA